MAQSELPNHDALLQATSAVLDEPETGLEYVVDLADQQTQAAAAQRRVAESAIARTVDPRTLSADLAPAVAEAEAAKLAATRLELAAAFVEDRHRELLAKANAAIHAEQYEHAASENRTVVERINRDFPGLRSKLLDLFTGIMTTQELVRPANRNLPAGKPAINGPEGTWGGFPDYAPGDGSPRAMIVLPIRNGARLVTDQYVIVTTTLSEYNPAGGVVCGGTLPYT